MPSHKDIHDLNSQATSIILELRRIAGFPTRRQGKRDPERPKARMSDEQFQRIMAALRGEPVQPEDDERSRKRAARYALKALADFAAQLPEGKRGAPRKDDLRERVIELRSTKQKHSWPVIKRILDRETGTSRTVRAYRNLANQPHLAHQPHQKKTCTIIPS